MLLLDDANLYERCCFLRDHGRPPGDRFFQNTEVGYKYKMSDLQAALGNAQLARLDELVARKRKIYSWYAERLKIPGTQLNYEPPDILNTYWMTSLVWDETRAFSKFDLMTYLQNRGIDTRPFFSQLSSIPAYKGRFKNDERSQTNQVARLLSERGINLPSALSLTEEQIAYTCEVVREFFTKNVVPVHI
jgi:perosamine synthetase